MEPWKCTSSVGVPSFKMAPCKFSNKVSEKTQIENVERTSCQAVETEVDIDLREVYFLILHFLSFGPCKSSFSQLLDELMEHQLLPRRYHAWFSREGVCRGDDDDDGISFPLTYARLVERYPHIEKDHLLKLLKQLMTIATSPLHAKVERHAPNAADVPTLLGTGSFSLLDCDRNMEKKQGKPLPAYLHWPHMQAGQVRGLGLREIGGGFTKHHRAPSIRSACYAIAKPSTMLQKMQNIMKLRGHRDAVYCAIFDRSGRYVITGADDRLVKIWSMETALCLASCRGHEGDITDLAVSSNNVLVASGSNDFVVRVWRLPDGMPVSVLQGHTGAVTAIAFSPRPNAVYQLLSSSDDGTCRIWDARSSLCKPRIYQPKPADTLAGKSTLSSNNGPSSSNGSQSHQILCCAYNADGTVFVTGSSDTFARVWSALKSNTDDPEQPMHEMDVLSGHENDVNYVQFSGCAVASKSALFDSLKEETIPKFKNSWFCHDNIVTCSRDGSAIIWVPRSRRSHGKVGRWTRAYHLKVPPPPLPPQPSRGGPRQRFLPTPRGVNMIMWSLDNRFVLAAIMDCRICVWNAVDGSLVHSLTGHSASVSGLSSFDDYLVGNSYVLDVHPFNPRIAMSAGYDGRTIVWDIWEGTPIRIYQMGDYKLVDGKFSADGTSIVLSDDVGQIYLINTGQGESQKDAKYDQFFLGDYRPVVRDASGNVLDQETQLLAHQRNIQDPLCDSSMIPYPEPYQTTYQQRRLGALGLEWRPSTIKFAIGPDFSLGLDYQMPPLADLERMVEPLPEFVDAMFWEPEIEVLSEDSDSEYNVADENSSEGEKENIVVSSSDDSECSTEDDEVGDDYKDGLRRSKRKKHKPGLRTSSGTGKRIKKRNLDEHAGTLSGSKTKKPKTGRKIAKKKTSKSKTSRPQRLAARNAQNMFSQITETSSDGEDEYESANDSSDSNLVLEDLNMQSNESDRNFKNMRQSRAREEAPSLDELEEKAKPPLVSESQSNVPTKPRLLLKFSLRDSKKQLPLEDTKSRHDNQADLVHPSSITQQRTQEKRIHKCSVDPASTLADATDVELSEDHNRNEYSNMGQPERAGFHLEGSAENKIRWGEVKMRTSRHSRSGDVDTSTGLDNSADDHMEKRNALNESVKPESMHGSILPCVDKEQFGKAIQDTDIVGKSSSMESSPLRDHELKCGDAAVSFNGNLNKRSEGPSASDKCIDDSLEIKEVAYSKHSGKFKENAPLNTTKIKIKTKKRILTDPRSPSTLSPLTGNEELTSPRDDLMSENPHCVEQDLITEVGAVRGTGRSCSSQFNYKSRTDLQGFDGDLEETNSSAKYLHDSVVDYPEAVTDVVRRTRSFTIKATSRETNTGSISFKVRGNHQATGTSKDAEEYSTKINDQFHRRSRSSRNHQGPSNNYDQSSSAKRISSHPVAKLSWLTLSEYEEGYRYIPQLGDEVVYLRQGHEEYAESVKREGPPRSLRSHLRAVEICKVEVLEYAWDSGSGESCCKITIKFIDPSSNVFGKLFKLTLPELRDLPDFVVEKTLYDAAIKRNWASRDKCQVWWKHEIGEGGMWWNGRIVSSQAISQEFPDSPWLRYEVRYKEDSGANTRHCPWELHDHHVSWERPHIDSESRDELLHIILKLERTDGDAIQQLNQAVQKLEFFNRVAAPFYPELIKSRLRNNYYRSLEAVKNDIRVMLSNAKAYFVRKEVLAKIAQLSDRFTRKLSRL
ncbi:Guanine nucleotide-binding protein, beta subunit [Trema orientale]|uniref:Guanine nucleotide-binding protein, beta subunit n=1 Tax=Trema orientale TaxID=63057 RepID=A0A2P5DGJ7_TREOI|nr:Guanine nucleotide-binding protein, beta subunit [Trema orientale]